MHHHAHRKRGAAAEHPRVLAVEHKTFDAGFFQQVARHPHLHRIDAGEDFDKFGLIDVGKVTEGDKVVVSGAAGATGSTVGQIARIKGAARVIGLAGSDDKCAWLVDELGFDAAVNYKTENVAARLREACPGGINLFFDNVGGELLDICLARLALRGRVVLCGAISSYNDRGSIAGPSNYRNLIPRRGRMEGFIILDYLDRFPAAQAEMAQWVAAGKVKFAVHIVDGLEHAPDALNLLFTGGNTGKVIVRVE